MLMPPEDATRVVRDALAGRADPDVVSASLQVFGMQRALRTR